MVFALSAFAHAQDSADGGPADALAAEPEESGPFRKLFVTLGRDIRQFPSADTAGLLVNGALLALAAYPLDDMATLGASSSVVLKSSFSGWGKALGREWVQGGGALAAFVAGRVFHKPTLAAAGGDLIEAQVLSVTLTQGLKFAVRRARPDGEARSFPSGHASAAFATAAVLQRHFGRRAALPAYAVAVYTSASRLQANSHYASDVIMGATLGLIVGRTVSIDFPGSRLQITPMPVRAGLAIVVSPVN
jgi:membrane-associated phospholipid phosphatase